MSKSARLRIEDARALVQLVNDCRDRGDDFATWCEHYASSLARMTGAGFVMTGVAALTSGPDAGLRSGISFVAGLPWGWENGYDRRLFEQLMAEHGGNAAVSPLMASYFGRPQGADGAGLTRRDLVSDRDWLASPSFRTHHEPIGFGHVIASFLALPGGAGLCAGVTLTRHRTQRQDFGARRRALAGEAPRLGPASRLGRGVTADSDGRDAGR
jgi:hypothetical protein